MPKQENNIRSRFTKNDYSQVSPRRESEKMKAFNRNTDEGNTTPKMQKKMAMILRSDDRDTDGEEEMEGDGRDDHEHLISLNILRTREIIKDLDETIDEGAKPSRRT